MNQFLEFARQSQFINLNVTVEQLLEGASAFETSALGGDGGEGDATTFGFFIGTDHFFIANG